MRHFKIKTIFSYVVVAALIFGFSISCKNDDKTGSEDGIPSQYNGYYKGETATGTGIYIWLHVQNGEAGQAFGTATDTTEAFTYAQFTGSGNTYVASGDAGQVRLTFSSDGNSVEMVITGATGMTVNLTKSS